jgi:ribA/ribD-fused uncharacterized protein
VEFLGLTFPSIEAAYQAAKTDNKQEREQFVYVNGGEAKRLGRTLKLRGDWEKVKNNVMFYLTFQKFSKHLELRKSLMATGERSLIEANNWKDTYWGVHFEFDTPSNLWVNKGGDNTLGTMLMTVRAALKTNE